MRRLPLAASLLDVRPTRARFLDGEMRPLPHWIAVEASYWNGGPASDEINGVWSAYRGGDVIDVGAAQGIYSLALAPAAKGGDIFVSLEPNPTAAAPLLETLGALARLFPTVAFTAIPRAAGTGERAYIEWPSGTTGRFGHPRVGSRADSGGEATVRVDDLVRSLGLTPALVKIDVEGAELDVLRGMPEVIAAGTTLMLELHPWQDYGELETLLPGYVRRDLTEKHGHARTLWVRESNS